jgi:hypothetical protein
MDKTKILLWDETGIPEKNDRLNGPVQHPNVKTLPLDVMESDTPVESPRIRTLCSGSRQGT